MNKIKSLTDAEEHVMCTLWKLDGSFLIDIREGGHSRSQTRHSNFLSHFKDRHD